MCPTDTRSPARRSAVWRCPKCLKPNDTQPSGDGLDGWKCSGCGDTQPAYPEAFNADGRLVKCPVCGCPDLYRQRDFNRKLGIGLIVIGAVLAPFTYYLSLPLFAGIDFLIYYFVPDVVVCYHCQASLRGYPGMEAIPPFDLNISDKYIPIERERGW
jgi:hypothetical protein